MERARFILVPFLALAAIGSLSCLTGLIGGSIPPWLPTLHLVPTLFATLAAASLCSFFMAQETSAADFQEAIIAGCPDWMRQLGALISPLAMINFIIAIALDFPGTLIFGLLLAFYAHSFLVLYSAVFGAKIYRRRSCPQGHRVSVMATGGCPKCGTPLGPAPAQRLPSIWRFWRTPRPARE